MKVCTKCKINKEYSEYYVSKYSDGYKAECKACNSLRKKAQYQNNLVEYTEYNRKYLRDNKHSFGIKFSAYKKAAKNRNLEFLLTKEECTKFFNTNCAYCNDINPTLGIDRVDNNIGYTPDNCVPCCSPCNFMKHAYSKEFFEKHVEKIYMHISSK